MADIRATLFLFLLFFSLKSLGLEQDINSNENSNSTKSEFLKENTTEYCVDLKQNVLTTFEKNYLIWFHTSLRENITKGVNGKFPKAFYMKKLLWNENLAEKAQNLVEQCPQKTNPYLFLNESLGQSILVKELGESSKISVQNLVAEWIPGLHYLTPEIISRYRTPKPGEFNFEPIAQMMWWNTSQFGCGSSTYKLISYQFNCVDSNAKNCWEKRTFVELVCNYFPVGNKEGEPVYFTTENKSIICQYDKQPTHCKDLEDLKRRNEEKTDRSSTQNDNRNENKTIDYRIRSRMIEFWPAFGRTASKWNFWRVHYLLISLFLKIPLERNWLFAGEKVL